MPGTTKRLQSTLAKAAQLDRGPLYLPPLESLQCGVARWAATGSLAVPVTMIYEAT